MYKKINSLFFGTHIRMIASSLVIFSIISCADYFVANERSLDVFYFIPIFLTTWRGNRNWGAALAVAGTLAWLADARIFAPEFSAPPQLLIWNTAVRLCFFLTLVFVLDKLRAILAKERAVSKLKSAMIHTVSHEFNNALTSISTGLFLLQETEPASVDELRSRLYRTIFSSQQKLQLYVKNILNEARVEDGKFKIEKSPMALRKLVDSSAGSVDGLLIQKNIKLEKILPEIPVLVNADKEALALVIGNLLGNAIKYTPQNGRITVEICPSGEPPAKVIFSVEDTGIGISLEDQKKIMTGFYRTAEGKLEADGFGLGLRIANELLTLHGSHLEISSEKGKGSSFFFELPAITPENAGIFEGKSG